MAGFRNPVKALPLTSAICISVTKRCVFKITKFRVVSEILECLESPEMAITTSTCLSFLQDLHALPAVRGIFSIYLKGGVKPRLNKSERTENVKSVMLIINYMLFQLNLKFSRTPTDKILWPLN